MQKPASHPRDLSVLVSGQALTSRTETIEEYLRERVGALGVIAIANPYARPGSATRRYYDGGRLLWGKPLGNLHFRKKRWFSQFLLSFVFLGYFFSILKAAREFGRTFDVFIGVSCFSAGLGLLLKKWGIVRKTVYYSIDYYRPPKRFGMNTVIVGSFRLLDRLCARRSDLTWHITSRIAEGREKFAGLKADAYPWIEVPLCYAARLLSPAPEKEVERQTLGFVGTLTPNQGWPLLIEAVPLIARTLPELRVEVIGSGVYADAVRRLAAASPESKRFVFRGFVPEEAEVARIISRTGAGLALWTGDEEDNALYADPGKPKFYAFSGIPSVVTRGTPIAAEIEKDRAGVATDYEPPAIAAAVVRLLSDAGFWRECRQGAIAFARTCTSEIVLGRAWEETLKRVTVTDY
jgi:glycosyltransferase involved in cell wall biosynthesis